MALVKLNPFIQGVSGSIGGLTFARVKNAQTARIRPKHRTPRTPTAITARARVTTQMLAWGGIPDAERLGWIQAAQHYTFIDALGQKRNLSPFNLFVKMRSYATTFATRTAYPLGYRTTPPATCIFNANTGGVGFQVLLTYHVAETANVLIYGRRTFAKHPVRPTRAFKFLGAWANQPLTVNIIAAWIAAFGTYPVGEFVEVKVITLAYRHFPSSPVFASDYIF
jgi:hypothetical protein